MSPGGRENQWGKGRLATHLVVRAHPKPPHRDANKSSYYGNEEVGQGKNGDGVEGTCQGEEKAMDRRLPAETPPQLTDAWGQSQHCGKGFHLPRSNTVSVPGRPPSLEWTLGQPDHMTLL